MKSLISITFIFLVFSTSNFAQIIDLDGKRECIVWKIEGKVMNSKSKDLIKVGIVIPFDSKLKIEEGASVTLANNDQLYTIEKKGTISVEKILAGKPDSISGGMTDFFKIMTNSKGYVKEKVKATEQTSSSTGKGWGTKSKIKIAMPTNSKLSPAFTTFKWTKPEGATSYTITLSQNEKTVIKAQTMSNRFSVNLDELVLKLGEACNISVKSNNGITSDPINFTIAKEGEIAACLAGLYKESEYQKAAPVQKMMMKAVTLESAGFHNTAAKKYKAALSDNPENELLQEMYSAFLFRQGLGFMVK